MEMTENTQTWGYIDRNCILLQQRMDGFSEARDMVPKS